MFVANQLVAVFVSLSLLFTSSIAVCQDATPPHAVSYSVVNSDKVPDLPDEYKHFQWHQFETANFEILAINHSQGLELLSRCEPLKTWCQRRWGLPDIPYQKKCMVLCVPTQEIFLRWFRQPDVDPRASKSKNADGSGREVYAIWIAGKSGYLTNVLPENQRYAHNLSDYFAFDDKKLIDAIIEVKDATNYNACNGNPYLPWNFSCRIVDYDQVARVIKSYMKLITSSDLPEYNDTLSPDQEKLISEVSKSSGIIKEAVSLSETTIHKPEDALREIYGWSDYRDFDESYGEYVRNLAYDIRTGRTPDMGMTWFVPKKHFGESK